SVAQLLQLGQGSILELDRKVGEAIDIYVNNRLVARGEVVEAGATREVFLAPTHPYTRRLLASAPGRDFAFARSAR
ncbi:MAG: FliM/FliN family flagellar motor switch protein, partial [Casimicrobiaceae bacterium]